MKPLRSLLLAAVVGWAASGPAQSATVCPPAAAHCVDAALLTDLLGWASRLSGLPAPADERPALQALPQPVLAQRVCGEQARDCRGLVAVYDTDRHEIAYADTLDLRDATDQSYLVHELVHYLQHRRHGKRMHLHCEAVLASEREAYAAQNRYLERFKQWRRAGEVMRFTHCPQDQTAAEPVVQYQGALR